MRKKIVTLFIAVLLLCSIVSPGTFAATFEDTEGKDCETAVETLASMGIINGKTEGIFAPDANLTRAEAAAILIRAMGIKDVTSVTDKYFEDVTEDHWAFHEIAMAYRLGFINGFDKNTFSPDRYVTDDQIVKMIVCVLGYGVQAESMGGYPGGYLAKAAHLSLLEGVTLGGSKAALRGNVAILLNNALEAPLFEKTSYGDNTGEYAESELNILSKYFNIEIVKGIVTADYYTTIEPAEDRLNKGEIAIGPKRYTVGDSGADAYIGQRVKLYYDMSGDTDAPKILRVEKMPAVTTASVLADEVMEETTKTKLVWEGTERKKSALGIAEDAILVYNGKVKEDWTAADLKFDAGVITAISNSGSSVDILLVSEYKNYIVQSMNTVDQKVYFMAAVEGVSSKVFDAQDIKVLSEYVDTSGTPFKLADLKKWDVLSVMESLDGKVMRVVKSSKMVSGTVNEVSESEVVIGETSYKVATSLRDNAELKKPSIGLTASYHLDFMGEVAAVDTESATNYKYGYIVSAANKEGMGVTAQFKIFTEDGEMKLFDAADRITINGVSCRSSTALGNLPKRMLYDDDAVKNTYSPTGETTYRQLIRYRTNADVTHIIEIETAENKTSNPADYAGDEGFNVIFEMDGGYRKVTLGGDGKKTATAGTNPFYAGGISNFAGKFRITRDTKIFKVRSESSDDRQWAIVSALDHGGVYGHAQLYDISESFGIGAMVWEVRASGSADAVYPLEHGESAMVTDISKGLDEDGESIYWIHLYTWDGKEIRVPAREDLACGYRLANTNLADTGRPIDQLMLGQVGSPQANLNSSNPVISVNQLAFGDVMWYSTDSDGFLEIAAVLYRAATPGLYEFDTLDDGRGATRETAYYFGGDLISNGTVEKVFGDAFIASTRLVTSGTGYPTTPVVRTFPVTANIMMLVDLDKKTYTPIQPSEILPGDVYLGVWRTIHQRMLLIYR